jgi:hypothetical protein
VYTPREFLDIARFWLEQGSTICLAATYRVYPPIGQSRYAMRCELHLGHYLRLCLSVWR